MKTKDVHNFIHIKIKLMEFYSIICFMELYCRQVDIGVRSLTICIH